MPRISIASSPLQHLPQLYLEGNATRGEDLDGTPGRNDELEAKVVLSWKLLDGGIRRNRESELSERTSEKVAEQMVLVAQLTEEVETSWARLTTGSAEVEAITRQVRQDAKVVAAYQDEYSANKRSLLDVLDAENSRFASQFELSNVRALHLFSSYELLAQMGVLLDTLGIEAPKDSEQPDDALPLLMRNSSSGGRYAIPPLSQE